MGSPLEVLANYNPTGFAQRNQLQAGAIQQQAQQTQALQLENVIRQRQLRDQDALTKAWAGVDTSAPLAEQQRQLTAGVIQNGGSGQAVIGVGQNYADLRQKYATATKDELANEAAIHDRNAGTIKSIIDGPPEDQQDSWTQALPRLKADYPGAIFPDQFPGNERATALMNQSLHLSTQVANAQKQSETGKNIAETGAANARAQGEVLKTRLLAEQDAREQAARANPNDQSLQQAALTGKERTDLQLKQIEFGLQRDKLNEELRHNRTNEGLRATTNSIAAGRLAQEQFVNGVKFSPDTIEYWVKTLQDNPDAVKEIPADIKGTVGKAFRISSGLPLPTPLEGTLKQNETNAGTSIENINRIRQLVADPEIQSRLGPILGRLGNVEQRVGAAAGLSPQAEEKAQELRTLMRYFVFQEGKTILGGRLPRQLMNELQSSSANTHMDAPTLAGALNGAEAEAGTVRDNAERARFGGRMRPPSMRAGAGMQGNIPTVTTKEQFDALPKGALFIEDGQQYRKP